jgi:RNA polymerase sigma-70 factor (ECF subfamily)
LGRQAVEHGEQPRVVRFSVHEDMHLMTAICARDMEAFEKLYRNYHPRLTRFLMNMVHRPLIVEEVFNDTMMVVWNRPESFNGTSRLSTWIFGIAYRQALHALRRLDEPIEDNQADARPSLGDAPDHELEAQRLQQKVLRALESLSLDHRTVVTLTYYQEMGYREIAEIMDCPVDTVKTRMFHARRHLKRILSGYLTDFL